MNAVILALFLSQIPPSSLVREKIHFDEEIHSKVEVTVALKNGNSILVPVINGYFPKIESKTLPDGSTLREYFYDDKVLYKKELEEKRAIEPVAEPQGDGKWQKMKDEINEMFLQLRKEMEAKQELAPKKIRMPSPEK